MCGCRAHSGSDCLCGRQTMDSPLQAVGARPGAPHNCFGRQLQRRRARGGLQTASTSNSSPTLLAPSRWLLTPCRPTRSPPLPCRRFRPTSDPHHIYIISPSIPVHPAPSRQVDRIATDVKKAKAHQEIHQGDAPTSVTTIISF